MLVLVNINIKKHILHHL